MFPESLVAARKLLEEITPLQTDCGLVCGGACCQTHPGEETGMLLFPGEAEMYRGEEVCPLARQGKSALSQDFVAAVRQAANLLAQDDQQAAHLRRLTDMQDELKALRAQYRGRKEHV